MCSSTPLTALSTKLLGSKAGKITGQATGESILGKAIAPGDSVDGRRKKKEASNRRSDQMRVQEADALTRYSAESSTLLGG
jgi:hypothetical protein